MKAALGIDIGGSHIKIGVLTVAGVVSHRLTVPTYATNGADALMLKLLEIVRDAKSYCLNNNIELCGIGVGTAGQVSMNSGTVAGATENLPGWAGMRLSDHLQRETGLEVTVDNDVNMIAMGEALQGVAKDWHDFICVAVGTGIGGCLMINRRIYHGRDGYAGEYGHQIVQMDGVACNCGGRGCWEQYASVTALKRLIAEDPLHSEIVDPQSLFSAAKCDDPQAIRIVDRFAGYIAIGLVNLIYAHNPGAIVLGGAIMAQGDFLLDRIRSEVTQRLMPIFHQPQNIIIAPAALGDSAGVIGAAGSFLISAGLID